MKAFHGDETLKADILKEVAWHREQDKLVRGTYGQLSDGDKFKGCAVGCTLHSYARIKGIKKMALGDHAAYEELLGVPRVLAKLEDGAFERLDKELAMTWP